MIQTKYIAKKQNKKNKYYSCNERLFSLSMTLLIVFLFNWLLAISESKKYSLQFQIAYFIHPNIEDFLSWIISLEKLELLNSWYFCFKNDLKRLIDYQNNQYIFCWSTNWLIIAARLYTHNYMLKLKYIFENTNLFILLLYSRYPFNFIFPFTWFRLWWKGKFVLINQVL